MPVSIPGMGKTFYLNTFYQEIKKNPKFDFKIISSDDIRKELMNDLRLKKPKLSEDDLFSQTGKDAGKTYR